MVGYENMLSIGDVCRFLELPTHTLRYWEKEFREFLSPVRTHGRQRRYTDEDMDRVRQIKKLLKQDGYSIAGAKKILNFRQSQQSDQPPRMNITEEMAGRIVDMVRTQFVTASPKHC